MTDAVKENNIKTSSAYYYDLYVKSDHICYTLASWARSLVLYKAKS